MSKILITGGTGFIGTNLSKILLSKGHNVIVSDLLSSNLDNSIRCDVGNIRQLEQLFNKIENVDYVYHLAAGMAGGMVKIIMKTCGRQM